MQHLHVDVRKEQQQMENNAVLAASDHVNKLPECLIKYNNQDLQ
jgi:hypothetical protein